MHKNSNRSIVAATAAGICIAAFASLMYFVSRSFRAAIAEIAEHEIRVTVINHDGSVFYDTDEATGSHAEREEVRQAFAKGRASALRHSDTLNRDLMYVARRVGEKVVRIAVPYTGVLNAENRFWEVLAVSGIAGAGIVAMVFFATSRLSRRIEEQSRRLEIVAANEKFRREFTSNVTHELKSPLTSIVGAVEMLGDGSALSDEERKDLFDIIRNESTRLGSLVGDVLSLAGIECEEECGKRDFAPLRIDDLIVAAVNQQRMTAQKAKIEIKLVANAPACVNGDAGRIEEILANLIDNAIKYSGSNTIEVKSVLMHNMVTVSVTDFGIGIASEHLPHIFERFYRVNKSRSRALGGTGLGLAIVKHLVRLHGGTVAAKSVPGLSTVFSFSLPAMPAQARDDHDGKPASPQPREFLG